LDSVLPWYVNSGPDDSVIDCMTKGVNVFLRAVPPQLDWERTEWEIITISAALVMVVLVSVL
jgi:hypothetical protein